MIFFFFFFLGNYKCLASNQEDLLNSIVFLRSDYANYHQNDINSKILDEKMYFFKKIY